MQTEACTYMHVFQRVQSKYKKCDEIWESGKLQKIYVLHKISFEVTKINGQPEAKLWTLEI